MSTAQYRKNIGYTTHADWNAEPETSTKTPKGLTEQVAKTAKGRAMQMHAEEVRDQVAETTQKEFELTEHPAYPYLRSGILEINDEGELFASPKADSEKLKAAKESLLDVRAGKKERQEIRELLSQVDEMIRTHEITEAPAKVAKSLKELNSLHITVRSAIEKKEYDRLPALNERLLFVAFEILDGLEKMRASDPDTMVDLVEQIRSSHGPISPCKSALIEFTKTHPVTFSEDTVDGLRYRAQKERGGKQSFTQALVAAYDVPKKKDDPYTFLQKVTRIPENRFRQIVEKALKS